jgi:hypothetical protein
MQIIIKEGPDTAKYDFDYNKERSVRNEERPKIKDAIYAALHLIQHFYLCPEPRYREVLEENLKEW